MWFRLRNTKRWVAVGERLCLGFKYPPLSPQSQLENTPTSTSNIWLKRETTTTETTTTTNLHMTHLVITPWTLPPCLLATSSRKFCKKRKKKKCWYSKKVYVICKDAQFHSIGRHRYFVESLYCGKQCTLHTN